MATKIEVPGLGESITQAVLLRWLKNDGEYVAADEPIVELETDKANVDIPAKSAGVVRQKKKPGDTVNVGEAIGRIDEGAPPSKPAPAATTAATAKAPAQPSAPTAAPPSQRDAGPSNEDLRPSVRRLVEENKLNPAQIP